MFVYFMIVLIYIIPCDFICFYYYYFIILCAYSAQ